MRIIPVIAAAFIAPAIALAAGSEDTNPPKTTKTTTECKAGQVFDDKTAKCVDKSSSLIDDDTRYGAVRELAYAGLYSRASQVLDAMPATDSRVMTYRGFIARKTGDMDAAMRFYAAALEANADNLLARSYMGQGMVQNGDRAGAALQLAEIRTRGGRNTWAEIALKNAIKTGVGSNY